MKIILVLSDKKREQDFCSALSAGFTKHGEEVTYIPKAEFTEAKLAGAHMVVVVGVKSRTIYRQCQQHGILTLLMDKGYFRNRDYFRFSMGGFQPPYLSKMTYGPERRSQMGIKLQPRRYGGKTVIFAGSSHKYCDFHDLGDVNDYARNTCAQIVHVVRRSKQVIYRPKPSWWANKLANENRIAPDEQDLPANTRFSGPEEFLSKLLPDCHCLVTHGSTAALDALSYGVPVVLLSPEGVSPAWNLCEHKIENILTPFWPSAVARDQLFSQLAWCQFNLAEMRSGFAWDHIKPWVPLV